MGKCNFVPDVNLSQFLKCFPCRRCRANVRSCRKKRIGPVVSRSYGSVCWYFEVSSDIEQVRRSVHFVKTSHDALDFGIIERIEFHRVTDNSVGDFAFCCNRQPLGAGNGSDQRDGAGSERSRASRR